MIAKCNTSLLIPHFCYSLWWSRYAWAPRGQYTTPRAPITAQSNSGAKPIRALDPALHIHLLPYMGEESGLNELRGQWASLQLREMFWDCLPPALHFAFLCGRVSRACSSAGSVVRSIEPPPAGRRQPPCAEGTVCIQTIERVPERRDLRTMICTHNYPLCAQGRNKSLKTSFYALFCSNLQEQVTN